MKEPNRNSRTENCNYWSKNSLDILNSQMELIEERISEPEDRLTENIQEIEQRKRLKNRKEQSLRDLLYGIQHSNICLERMGPSYFHIFHPASLLSNPRSFLWGLKIILSPHGSSNLSSENLEFLYSFKLTSLSTGLTIVSPSFLNLLENFPTVTHQRKKTHLTGTNLSLS